MTVYWIMVIIPMILTFFFFGRKKNYAGVTFLFFLFYVFLIGLRDKVGMDWNNYLYNFSVTSRGSFLDVVGGIEPGFAALNWVMESNGLGIYGVNVVAAMFFTTGLFSYAKKQCVQTWSAIAVVIPYLVIVIAMSATRQAMAIGIFLFALAYWNNIRIITKAGIITFAFLFHASAIAFLPLVIIEMKTHFLVRYSLLVISAWLSYIFIIDAEQVQYYNEIYIEQNIQSSGAIMHIMLNFLPATVYFGLRNKIIKIYGNDNILYLLSLLSLLALPAAAISSTGVDRLSLYFSAVQMKIYSGLPFIFRSKTDRIIIQLLIFGFTLLVLFVWLNYSNHSFAYIPYRNYWIN